MKMWRDKTSGVWQVRFLANGQRVQRSLGTKVKGEAEAVALRIISEEKIRATGSEPVVTLDRLRQKWLDANGSRFSKGHWHNVEVWPSYHLGKLQVDRIGTGLAEEARNQHAEGREPSTVNAWVRILNLLGNYAVRLGMIPEVPWKLSIQKVQKKPRVTLPAASVSEWIQAAVAKGRISHRPQLETALRLMIGMGLRKREAVNARWEWLDWDRGIYTVGKAKGFEARRIPVPAWLLAWLKPQKQAKGLILGKQHSIDFVRRAIERANEVMGTPGLSPHRLRGTFATLHSEAGTPVQVIQHLLGHKSPTTTLLYLEVHAETAAAQQAEVARRMGFEVPQDQTQQEKP